MSDSDKVAVSFALWALSAWWAFIGFQLGRHLGR